MSEASEGINDDPSDFGESILGLELRKFLADVHGAEPAEDSGNVLQL